MKAYIHVDVDSPIVLNQFYKKTNNNYSIEELEIFYETSFERALKLFDEFNIKASFFCVGNELRCSSKIQKVIKNAFEKGHQIANHTYTHPFGLCNLEHDQIINEISGCNEIIQEITKVKPAGFRTPGYAMNSKILRILTDFGFRYDSSAGWPIMHYLMKILKSLQPLFANKMDIGHGETNIYFKQKPYSPLLTDWRRNDKTGNIILKEMPLPSVLGIMPFYNNILLGISHRWINRIIKMQKNNSLIYLVHQIEFCSVEDSFIPETIRNHPHLKKSVTDKENKMRFIFSALKKKYKISSIENEIDQRP